MGPSAHRAKLRILRCWINSVSCAILTPPPPETRFSWRSKRNSPWLEPWQGAAARRAYTYKQACLSQTAGHSMVCLNNPTSYEQQSESTLRMPQPILDRQQGMASQLYAPLLHLTCWVRFNTKAQPRELLATCMNHQAQLLPTALDVRLSC